MVRKASPLDSRIITCFEIYMGCSFDPRNGGSFYQKPEAYATTYDTGIIENAFELTRLRIEEIKKIPV